MLDAIKAFDTVNYCKLFRELLKRCISPIVLRLLLYMYTSQTLRVKWGHTGQVGLGVGSWPSNRATEGSNPKGTRLYFVILLKNVEKIFDWH